MNLRPLPLALVALAGGVLAAPALPLPLPLCALLTALCAAAGLLGARRTPLLAGGLLLGLAFFGIGHARIAAATARDDVSRWIGGPSVRVLGTVASDVEEAGSGRSPRVFLVSVRAVDDYLHVRRASGLLHVSTRAGGTNLIRGDEVWLRGRIALPASPANPGGFDYTAHLRRGGVRAALAARGKDDVQPTGRVLGSPFGRAAARLRVTMRAIPERHLKAEDAALLERLLKGSPDEARENAALLNGLLLSIRSGIPADLDNAFTRTGTIHILSVSGLHVAAIAWFLGWLSGAFSAPRLWANGGTVALLWIYALVAGAGPAVTRSALMLTVLLLAPLLRRTAEPLNSLLLAAFLLLCLSPTAIYDAGTQLSFATVATLLLWMPPLERLVFPWEPVMRLRAKTARWVLLAFLAGLVAHAGSWPLVAFHFNLFSVIAPLANVFIAPLAEGLILIGLAAMPLAGVPFAGAGFFVLLLAPGLRLLRALVLRFAALPWAAVSVASPPIWFLVVYYALLWGLAPLVRERVLRKTLFAPDPPAAPGAAPAGGAVAASPSR